MPAICASIMEQTLEGFLKAAKDLEVDLIELRVDGLMECTPEKAHSLLLEFKKTTKAKVILSVRKKSEGGRFKGTEEDRKKVILGCLHLADLVDIELRSEIRDEVVSKARANRIGVIISYHDFEKTPSIKERKAIIDEERKAGADYPKIAFKANSLRHTLRLLEVVRDTSKKGVIAVSMGEPGRISRIAAPFFGSAITYAAAGEKTAPGQLTLEETKKAFEILGVK